MNKIDETFLLSSFAVNQQSDIAQDILDSYNLANPSSVKAGIRNAVWRGFLAGFEATKRYYEHKE